MTVIPNDVELCEQYFLQLSSSNCFHGKRSLWELKLVKTEKTSIFIVDKRLQKARVKFLIEHDRKEFK